MRPNPRSPNSRSVAYANSRRASPPSLAPDDWWYGCESAHPLTWLPTPTPSTVPRRGQRWAVPGRRHGVWPIMATVLVALVSAVHLAGGGSIPVDRDDDTLNAAAAKHGRAQTVAASGTPVALLLLRHNP